MHRIGVQSARWFSLDDPDGSIRFIRECGFNTIDFNIDNMLPGSKISSGELTEFFDKSVAELCDFYTPLKEALEKHDVTVAQMHAPFPLWVKENPKKPLLDPEKVNEYMIMVVGKICAVCDFLGCPAVVVHPITRSTKEKEIATNLEMYRRMMPAAKKYGVKLCLENLFGSFNGRSIEGACSAVEEACWYIDTLNEEAGEELFGFCLDVGHATLMGRNLYQYITRLGKRLTILHIHDNDGKSDLHMMPYTYTHNWGQYLVTDWDGFVRGLKDIGYEGDLCFETFRVLGAFPRDLWREALGLISATGRYFVKNIEADA